jgi:glutaredoxin
MDTDTRFRPTSKRSLLLLVAVLLLPCWLTCTVQQASGIDSAGQSVGGEGGRRDDVVKARCVALECYFNLSNESTAAEVEFIRNWVSARQGVSLKLHNLDLGEAERERFKKVLSAYKITDSKLPVVYGLNRVVTGPLTLAQWETELTQLLTMQVYVRQGCSQCAKAKEYLPKFRQRYPGIEIEYLDAVANADARKKFSELSRNLRIGGVSFPGFWLCRQLVVGFDNAQTTGARLDAILQRWTYDCEIRKKVGQLWQQPPRSRPVVALLPLPSPVATLGWGLVAAAEPVASLQIETDDPVPDLPFPGDAPDLLEEEPLGDADLALPTADEIDVPWMGRISASRLGMPAFTFLIGLVDGFNPCAMWVLLFLLSVLVNLRVRWKIFAVAGTFVLVSGLAYFAFMAAWLNLLLFVGYLRWVQIILASLAILIGLIHIKDFFAFKRGFSLSIPDSAKPGLYARVRQIVMAEHLYGAIAGAFVLAVLVNFIELLCTAGLPAMYTQVLMLQEYPPWKNYAYLALYILAYMLDDSIMVGIVVLTLGKRKLQENEGRWLKLMSGLVVLALGVVLLFKPEWLG